MASRFDVLDVMQPRVFEGDDGVVVMSTFKLRTIKNEKEWIKPLCQFVKVDPRGGRGKIAPKAPKRRLVLTCLTRSPRSGLSTGMSRA